MDIDYIIFKEYGAHVVYNPAFVNLSEEQAKKLNMWPKDLPMPTKGQLMALWESKYKAELDKLKQDRETPKNELKKLKGKENWSQKETEAAVKYLMEQLGL